MAVPAAHPDPHTSADYYSHKHSFNRYAYANNNPNKFVDLDGREAVKIQSPSWMRFIPGQNLWDGARTAFANENYGSAAALTAGMVTEIALVAGTLGGLGPVNTVTKSAGTGEVAAAADRLGVDLSTINISQGVARTKICTAESINAADVNTLLGYAASKGATSVEVDTGFVLNSKLSDFLSRRVQDGKSFFGGKVTSGTEYGSDFTITY